MEYAKDIKEKFYFYKKKETDKIWWVDFPDMDSLLFLSIKKRFYSFFGDCPKNFSPEELEIFKKEQPFWAKFLNLK